MLSIRSDIGFINLVLNNLIGQILKTHGILHRYIISTCACSYPNIT